jgi:KUP system potassium uptake protein
MSAASLPAGRHDYAHGQARSLWRWRRRQAFLTLGALGVVYGDIGTSPLYAVRQSVLATGGEMPNPIAVMGAI